MHLFGEFGIFFANTTFDVKRVGFFEQPAQDRDAPGRRMEDPFRGRGLERRGEDSLREVEHEGPRRDEVVADRPSVRRKDRQERGRTARVELAESAVVRPDRVEGGLITRCVVKEDRQAVSRPQGR